MVYNIGIGRWVYLLGLVLASPWLLLGQQRARSVESYITVYQSEARAQMQKHRIPASITIAQGIVETGAGKSTLATIHNNHFGIKCHSTWTGARTYRTDDAPNECFRSYERWQDSFEDHSLFLKGRRYQRLFALQITDYQGWARGLQKAGYATNPGYANMLIKMIEQYELYVLDRGELPSWMVKNNRTELAQRTERERRHKEEVKSMPSLKRTIYMSSGLLYVVALQGDNFDLIAKDLDMDAHKLAKWNDVSESFPLQAGDIVYLERKHRKADPAYNVHTVDIGESMHSISQRYGVRLDRLYKMNNKDADYTPTEGDVLRLR